MCLSFLKIYFFILQGEAINFFPFNLLDSCVKRLPSLRGRKSSEVSTIGSYNLFHFIHIHFILHIHQLISQSAQWATEREKLTGSGRLASSGWMQDENMGCLGFSKHALDSSK